jgi:glycosyltransferase involved in cell wall biosynthesis
MLNTEQQLDAPPVYLSLIVATLGRTKELGELLQTLVDQNDDSFETIIVDQNDDNRLDAVIAPFLDRLTIHHIRSSMKGLSRSRNLGCKSAKGSWLLFPDDDCWYPADFIKKLRGLIATNSAQIYCGRAISPEGEEIMGWFAKEDTMVDHGTVWGTMIEWIALFRRDVYDEAGGFNEDLGVGSGTAWGSSEGPDLVLRCIYNGAVVSYHTDLFAHHPDSAIDRTSPANIRKMYMYNAGYGYVMRKHRYPFSVFLPDILRPIGGIAFYALTGRLQESRRSYAILRGRLTGWFSPEARRDQFNPNVKITVAK